jgi:hypothetical protein
MGAIGLGSELLFGLFGAQTANGIANAVSGQNAQNTVGSGAQSEFQQFQTEVQQLGQDLTAGNLTQAQTDFATLAQNFPALQQAAAATTNTGTNAATPAAAAATATTATPAATANTNPIVQAFGALENDLNTGNLTQAQTDFATLAQDLQGGANGGGAHFHHHHFHGGGGGANNAQAIGQDFSSLASALQGGNLSSAQTAFTNLQQALEQGALGVAFAGVTGVGATGTSGAAGSTGAAGAATNNLVAENTAAVNAATTNLIIGSALNVTA